MMETFLAASATSAGVPLRTTICSSRASSPGSRSASCTVAKCSSRWTPSGGRWECPRQERVGCELILIAGQHGNAIGGSRSIAGLRAPFARSGTVFRDVSAVALARHAAREVLYLSAPTRRPGSRRGDFRPGGALGAHARRGPRISVPQFPANIPGLHAQQRACASSGQTISNAAEAMPIRSSQAVDALQHSHTALEALPAR